jgi:hypothetical protein
MSQPFRLLLIGDSDSQLLACEALCQFPSDCPVEVTINAIPRDGTPDAILSRAASLGRLWRFEMGRLLTHPELNQFDAIGVYLTGSKISDFRLSLALLPEDHRPLLFCGFNGVVLEKFMEGMSWRLGYDVICISGPRDQDTLQRMVAGTPFNQQTMVVTGLRRNSTAGLDLLPHKERPKRLTFAEQVVMPSRKEDRIRLVRILADLARRSPNWEVLIKPRIAPGETTFHKAKDHISETLRRTLGHPPNNLRLDYRALPDLLQSSRLMATVSSTAFFDALDFGCRPVVMADFGISPGNGSHVFAGSGVWRSLEQLNDLDELDRSLPQPDPSWLTWMGYSQDFSPESLIRVLLERKDKPNPPLELPSGHLTNANLSFTQLRRSAEVAIKKRNWAEASSLLQLGTLMRPTHRNVARRLRAVRSTNPLLKRLLLLLTYREVG